MNDIFHSLNLYIKPVCLCFFPSPERKLDALFHGCGSNCHYMTVPGVCVVILVLRLAYTQSLDLFILPSSLLLFIPTRNASLA